MLQVRIQPCYFVYWLTGQELATCLQPQEAHETNLIEPLEAGAKEQRVKKAPNVLRDTLPSANLPNQREHAANLIPNTTGHKSPHPKLP